MDMALVMSGHFNETVVDRLVDLRSRSGGRGRLFLYFHSAGVGSTQIRVA